jgi:hypothetical protein
LLGSVDTTGCELFDPKNCTYDPNRARHVNTVDNTVWYQGGTRQIADRYRVQVDPSVTCAGTCWPARRQGRACSSSTAPRSATLLAGEFVFSDRTTPARPSRRACAIPMTSPDACFARTRQPLQGPRIRLGVGIYCRTGGGRRSRA